MAGFQFQGNSSWRRLLGMTSRRKRVVSLGIWYKRAYRFGPKSFRVDWKVPSPASGPHGMARSGFLHTQLRLESCEATLPA